MKNALIYIETKVQRQSIGPYVVVANEVESWFVVKSNGEGSCGEGVF